MLSIETDRLLIRNFRPDDWQELQEMSIKYQASEAAKYEDRWPTSAEGVKGMAAWFARGDEYLAVCLKTSGKLIGLVAIDRRKQQGSRVHNLGYVFRPDYHGQGYAAEGCHAAMAHVFGELAADGILTGTRLENATSVRLLERLGLKPREGHPGEFTISREEWLAQARRRRDVG